MDEVSALVQVDLAVSDEEMHGRLCREEGVLLQLLVPQLRLCLLAEVAAGLLVPGHPLPPDTPEHAAALYRFIKAAGQQLLLEGEVPLQVVVLLGALEQLQGLALAGVRQQDVWEAGQAAAAALAAAGRHMHGEQQQQQQQQQRGVPAAGTPSCGGRLLWGLLGRLKPTAQAWYVQYYGMCPHCPERRLWQLVSHSLGQCLWLPLNADPLA
ncbi:hypothetical protein OEZ86_009088 [Tetradesmus obliquus]|nr:hypothetical protein OEZ86_009088 [Tetradesmus obliquus]